MFKIKNTGRAIGISAIIVCVCFAMLLGTTFAWFTSTASTKVNRITTGKFDIDIVDVADDGTIPTPTTSLVGQTLAFGENGEFNSVLWEPGMTIRTQTFAVINNGQYALDFKLDDVFANAETTDNKGTNVDLTDAISYKVIKINGTSESQYVYTDDNGTNVGEEIKLLPGESQKFVIELYMNDQATNEFQECELSGIAVSVSASQAMYENDKDGTSYDSDATFDTFEDPWVTTTATTTNP